MKHLICAALIGLTVSSAAVPALAAKGGHRESPSARVSAR